MSLLDIITAPWAITPVMLAEITEIYNTHLRGDKINLDALREQGIELNSKPVAYEVVNGVALISASGVMAKKMNLFSQISGGISSQVLGNTITEAIEDTAVNAIVLDLDSPGGAVDGTAELAELIDRAAAEKPILVYSDGLLASAAYWVAAAADEIFISSENVAVGSIGVIAQHVDVSEAKKKQGITVTEVVAGRYKAIGSENKPLDDEARAVIQARVDRTYRVFIENVARFRGVDPIQVHEQMGDGRVFMGSEAVERGLVDGVATLSETIERAAGSAAARRAGVARRKPTTTGAHIMDIATLQANYPDLVQAIEAEARQDYISQADHEAAIERAEENGRTDERERIKDIKAQSVPGYEAIIEKMIADPEATGDDAARAIIAAEQKQRTALLNENSGNDPVPPSDPDTGARTMKRADFDQLSDAQRREALKEGVTIVQ
jgi:signal peptide peptidase SppA